MPVSIITGQYAGREEYCRLVGKVGDYGPSQLLIAAVCLHRICSLLVGRCTHYWKDGIATVDLVNCSEEQYACYEQYIGGRYARA